MSETKTKKRKLEETTNEVDDAIVDHIQWVQVSSTKTRESVAFYAKFLGWKAAAECDYTDMWTEVAHKPNSTNISFHGNEKGDESSIPGAITLVVVTKDLSKFHDRVKDIEGLKVKQEPTRQHWGGFTALYTAPDGVDFSVLNDWPKGDGKDQKETDCSSNNHSAKEEPAKAAEEPIKRPAEQPVDQSVEKPTETPYEEKTGGNGICHLEIPVEDVDRAKKFFEETFKWSFQMWGDMLFFETNDPKAALSGGLVLSKERIIHPILYFNAGPVDEALERIKQNGGKIVKEKYSVAPNLPEKTAAHFSDTEGNVWMLYHDEKKK